LLPIDAEKGKWKGIRKGGKFNKARNSTQPEATSVASRVRADLKSAGVDLKETGFPVIPGIMSPDGNMPLQEFSRFCPADTLERQFFPTVF
jgi:hypothetical protein